MLNAFTHFISCALFWLFGLFFIADFGQIKRSRKDLMLFGFLFVACIAACVVTDPDRPWDFILWPFLFLV